MMVVKISWTLYGDMLKELTTKIKKSGVKYDYILAIMRSGYPVGLYLSNHLKIPLLGIQVQNHRYNEPERGETKQELTVGEIYSGTDCFLLLKEFNILIVDEIMDTGESMKAVLEKVKKYTNNIYTAVLMLADDCKPEPTFYVDYVPECMWVVFPYEPNRD